MGDMDELMSLLSAENSPGHFSDVLSTSTDSHISQQHTGSSSSLTSAEDQDELPEIPSSESTNSLLSTLSNGSSSLDSNHTNLSNDDFRIEWLFEPAYEGSDVLNGNVLHRILDIFVTNTSTKQVLDKTLSLVESVMPGPNNFPKTRYFLLKRLHQLMPHSFAETVTRHRLCDSCHRYLGKWHAYPPVTICDVCSSTDVSGVVIQFSIRAALQDAFEVRNLHHFIDKYRNECGDQREDVIYDITSGSEIKRLRDTVIQGPYDLCLMWAVDGVPTDDETGELWALQAQIVNVGPRKRRAFQFPCGLYYSNQKSKHKPEMLSFLKPFTEELQDLFIKGIEWRHKESGRIMKSLVIAPVATLDAPARACAQNLKQYNAEYGCSFCEHPGETCPTGGGHNHVFLLDEQIHPLRTKERMLAQARTALNDNLEHKKGVKGPSITNRIPLFDPSKGFVPDYMHAVLLGVLMMLILLWLSTTNKDKPFHLRKRVRKEIDESLLEIRPPDYVTRTPRSLEVISHWKASELRAFLLYYGPVILKDRLPRPYYQHFLLLVRAIRILSQSSIRQVEMNLAETLIHIFVSEVEDLYGRDKCSFNVHQLLHLPDFVRMWGPLWAWSAFPFEDGNGYLVRMAHGTNRIEVELANNMHFVNALQVVKNVMELGDAERDYQGFALGAPVDFRLSQDDITAILDATSLTLEELNDKKVSIYRRINFRNEKYTSSLYVKETKRNNSCIFWNNRKCFGELKFFVSIDNSLFGVVRELLMSTNRNDQIVYTDLGMKFNDFLIPVRSSYCVSAVPLEKIEGKLVRVMNYVCLPPNEFERK